MRSRQPRNPYQIESSPLYRLLGEKQFETVAGVPWDAVPDLLASEGYLVWKNKKGREIQAPVHRMSQVHRKLGSLLSRVQVPDYVYSQKGRSYADNARAHVGRKPLIKTDVSKFYPSVTRAMVFRMFVREFRCAEDVAHRLADICCYKQAHLPTGSPLSGRAAYFAARPMFDEIQKFAKAAGCVLSVYVDDITISGQGSTGKLLSEVRGAIRRHGFKSKDAKSMTFPACGVKPVTGAIVNRPGISGGSGV